MTATAPGKARTCPPRHVLVVDDSEAEREIMALTLDAAFPGITVSHTANPLLARAMCDRRAFDCVLLDYNMPELDGLTLAAELRAGFAHLPIILMTSVGDEMLAAEALRGGVSDYLPKARVSPYSIRRTVDRSILACGQERVIQEQKAELENFAYALAHDFKQPIRQIITFAQLIDEQVGAGDAGVRQHLSFLGDAAGRLGRLVDVMTQYTLLNQPPSLGEVDLNIVVASVRAALAPYLAERGGSFVAPEQVPTVWGNDVLMTQVLQNLVFNGLHYNQSPSPRVDLTVEGDDDSWTLEFRDNGVGIEPQYLAEIFKPLVRLHNASEYAGTGLGLTLARKAMLAQKGDIWCESTPGIGSVFRVRAPRSRRQQAAPPGGAPHSAEESRPKVA